jgi:hypothetical protein
MGHSVVEIIKTPLSAIDAVPSEHEFKEEFDACLETVANFPIRGALSNFTPGPRVLADMGEGAQIPNGIYIRPIPRQDLFQYGPKWGLYFYSRRTPSDDQRKVRFFLDWDDYDVDTTGERPRLEYLKRYLRAELESLLNRRDGSVTIEHDVVRITPSNSGIRRSDIIEGKDKDSSAVTQKASLCAFLHQYTADVEWQWFYFQPEFYAEAIHPHLKDNAFSSPVVWASSCMELVHGHALAGLGHDYRALPPELAFMPVAAVMGNLRNEALDTERVFPNDAWGQEAYRVVSEIAPHGVLADALLFAIENRSLIATETLSSPAFARFVEQLPLAIKSGLTIDRASHLFAKVCNEIGGDNGENALSRCTQIISDIYCSGQAPWWFRRDVTLAHPSLRESEVSKLASIAGFAYEETAELYAEKGRELAAFSDVGEEAAMRFCSYVINNYGAGNPKRALSIAQYAVDLMREYGPLGSAEGLAGLEDSLEREKPASKIIAVLEGDEVNFQKSGLISLLAVFGMSHGTTGQLSDVTSQVGDLLKLHAPLSLPIENRAFNPVPVRASDAKHTAGLLGTHLSLGTRALLLELNPAPPPRSPAVAWHEFDRRLPHEVVTDRQQQRFIAMSYFAFFAQKMPEPLNPPPGFLAFLHRYDSIRDPNTVLTWPGFRSNYHEAIEHNNDLLVQKFAALSAVLDAQLIGLVSSSAVSRLFAWITAPLALDRRTQIEVAQSYAGRQDARDMVAHRAYGLLELHHQLERKVTEGQQRMIPRDRHRLLDPDFTPNEWAQERLGETNKKLANIEEHYHRERTYGEPSGFQSYESMLLTPPEIDQDEVIENTRRAIAEAQGDQQVLRRERFCALAPLIYNLNLLVAAGALNPREHRYCLDSLIGVMISRTESAEDFAKLHEEQNERWDREVEPRLELKPEPISKHFGIREFEALPCFDPTKVSAALASRLAEWSQLEGFIDEVRASVALLDAFKRLADEQDINGIVRGIPGWKGSLLQPKAKVIAAVYPGWMHQNFLRSCAGQITQAVSQINAGLADRYGSLAVANHALLGSYLMQCMLTEAGEGYSAIERCEEIPKLHKKSLRVLVSAEKLHAFEESVTKLRKNAAALLPIGCKLHLHSPIDGQKLRALQQIAPFGFSGGFKVDNADTCLVLPAMTSARELVEVARLLVEFKIISPQFPEYQFCIRGRLAPKLCAVLGATILLTAEDNPEYALEMFSSNGYDRQTGRRMVIYDAHGPLAHFPGNPKVGRHYESSRGFDGRTDIIGLIDITRAPTFQLVGSILSNGMFGGPLAELSEPFQNELRSTLERHGIADVLDTEWVLPEKGGRQSAAEHFHQGVIPCLNAWKKALEGFEEAQESGAPNIILEIRTLVDSFNEKATIIRDRLLNDPRFMAARRELYFEKK